MRIVFFGPPGSGKGTYASRISKALKIPHVSTGDIFREEIAKKSALGKVVKAYLDKGKLVPDNIVIEVMKKRLRKHDCKNGCILDGFPRTIAQLKMLDEVAKPDLVINLNVPRNIIITRLSTRRTCKNCGEIYNLLFIKPKKEGICDKCGGKLYQRSDEKPNVIKKRLRVYEKQSKPLINYYRKKGIVKDVVCKKLETPPDTIVKKILRIIDKSL